MLEEKNMVGLIFIIFSHFIIVYYLKHPRYNLVVVMSQPYNIMFSVNFKLKKLTRSAFNK